MGRHRRRDAGRTCPVLFSLAARVARRALGTLDDRRFDRRMVGPWLFKLKLLVLFQHQQRERGVFRLGRDYRRRHRRCFDAPIINDAPASRATARGRVKGKTMRKLQVCFLTAFLGFLTGCASVVSLHPLVLPNDQDAIFDPALVGTWQDVDPHDRTVYTVSRAESGYYVVLRPSDPGD